MYIHMYTHTYIHTYIHTYVHTYIHTYVHMYTHTYVHTYVHTYIHTYICTYIHTYIHTYICTHIHTYVHTYIHTYISTYVHTYIHIHTLYMYHSQSKHTALPLFTQVLTDNDAERIRSGQCLQSDQINLAVQLIRQQHPQQQGLLCTLLLQSPDKLPKLQPDSIQIHHVAGNHWVGSKNCGTHIKLFDSLYNGWLTTDLNTQLQALYFTNEGSLEVRVQRV